MTVRTALLVLAVIALPGTSLMAQGRRGDRQAGEYGWISNLESGKAQARTTGKPLMVVLRCVP
jgi:hypothetical protein